MQKINYHSKHYKDAFKEGYELANNGKEMAIGRTNNPLRIRSVSNCTTDAAESMLGRLRGYADGLKDYARSLGDRSIESQKFEVGYAKGSIQLEQMFPDSEMLPIDDLNEIMFRSGVKKPNPEDLLYWSGMLNGYANFLEHRRNFPHLDEELIASRATKQNVNQVVNQDANKGNTLQKLLLCLLVYLLVQWLQQNTTNKS